MAYANYTLQNQVDNGIYAELQSILASLDDDAIIDRLQEYRPTGRPGYPLRALWNTYVATFYLNLPHTNSLIRRLTDDPTLQNVCGFEEGDQLPGRRTFNRFNRRLADHSDLVEALFASLTSKLRALIPDLGEEVAIDATAVRTHSNPRRKPVVSDPDADWGVKHTTQSKNVDSTEYFFGYKVHMVADANHNLPLSFKVTSGKRSDSPELPAVMDKAQETYDWFKPTVAIADRGYDAKSNFEYLYLEHGIDPLIHIRKPTAKDGLYDGIYNADILPTCLGMEPMEFVGETGDGQYIFRCRSEGCHLKNSTQGGTRHCDTAIVENPMDNIRVFGGRTRRNSPEWKSLYKKRWSVERVFKSMKESRRLETHCVRQLAHITLHAVMSTLIFQATAYVHFIEGRDIGWMVPKVA